MSMTGVILNSAAIIVGTAIGLLLKKGLSESLQKLMMSSLGFCVIVMGLADALQMNNVIVILISVLFGGVIGHLLKLEERINSLGDKVGERFKKKSKNDDEVDVSQGFIMSTIIFCVGMMSIMGSIKAGLSGDQSTLYVKSVLDFVSSIIFASTMGFGVGLSAIPVFFYQGLILVFARFLQPIFTDVIIQELSAVGGVVIMMIGFGILELKKMPVADFLPSMLIPIAYYLIMGS